MRSPIVSGASCMTVRELVMLTTLGTTDSTSFAYSASMAVRIFTSSSLSFDVAAGVNFSRTLRASRWS